MSKKAGVGKIVDFRKLSPRDGDIVLIKHGDLSDDDKRNILNALQRSLNVHRQITVLFVNSLSDLRTLNEQQMKKYGWQRVDVEED